MSSVSVVWFQQTADFTINCLLTTWLLLASTFPVPIALSMTDICTRLELANFGQLELAKEKREEMNAVEQQIDELLQQLKNE